MVRTLEEWRDHLLPKLSLRIIENQYLRRMYDGDHPTPTSPNTSDPKYRRLAEMAITNLCGLVVDAPTSKLTPQGVRLSADGDADLPLWRQVWTANKLNALCRVAHEEALKVGRSAALVWPQYAPDEETVTGVSVTIEDADQVLVAYAPGSTSQRVAALKWYYADEFDYVTVWTASDVLSWKRPASPASVPIGSGSWDVDDDMPGGKNPLGSVPVVEFLSKPNAKGHPSPELSLGVLRLQTRINKTMFDIVVAGEDGAFPQRVGVGIEVAIGPDGNPINPLTVGPNRVWFLNSQDPQNPSNAKIDQFTAYDTTNLLAFADASIRELGWISRTSAIFMLGGSSNVGADMIRALDDGHRAKVVAHQIVLGEAWEEVFALALAALGQPVPDDIEIDWASPQFGSPAEMADAALKLRQVGYSFKAIARYVGASPAEVVRLIEERNQEEIAGTAAAPKGKPVAPQAGGPVPLQDPTVNVAAP